MMQPIAKTTSNASGFTMQPVGCTVQPDGCIVHPIRCIMRPIHRIGNVNRCPKWAFWLSMGGTCAAKNEKKHQKLTFPLRSTRSETEVYYFSRKFVTKNFGYDFWLHMGR